VAPAARAGAVGAAPPVKVGPGAGLVLPPQLSILSGTTAAPVPSVLNTLFVGGPAMGETPTLLLAAKSSSANCTTSPCAKVPPAMLTLRPPPRATPLNRLGAVGVTVICAVVLGARISVALPVLADPTSTPVMVYRPGAAEAGMLKTAGLPGHSAGLAMGGGPAQAADAYDWLPIRAPEALARTSWDMLFGTPTGLVPAAKVADAGGAASRASPSMFAAPPVKGGVAVLGGVACWPTVVLKPIGALKVTSTCVFGVKPVPATVSEMAVPAVALY